MKRLLAVLVVLILTAMLYSCTKTPVPCFTIMKTKFLEKDTILFMNCSKHGKFYRWSFGDGETSTDDSPLHYYKKAGTYTITLTENSRSFYKMKEYSTTQTITVIKVIKGCMDPISLNYNPLANVDDGSCANAGIKTLYFSDPSIYRIEVNVDQQLAGVDSVCYSSSLPDCSNPAGCVKVTGVEGAHTYDAYVYDYVGNYHVVHGTFYINPNVCELLLLQ